MPATEIVTCAAQGQKGGSRWRKAALQLRRRHSGLNAFAKGRLAEIFDAPFEFFVVPVDFFSSESTFLSSESTRVSTVPMALRISRSRRSVWFSGSAIR